MTRDNYISAITDPRPVNELNGWSNDYLEEAALIGRRLCRDALWGDGRCNWLSENLELIEGAYTITFKALDNSLYSGTAGVAYFLQTLYRFQPSAILKRTIIGAANQMLHAYDTLTAPAHLGYFSGVPGVIDCLLHIAEALGLPELEKHALHRLDAYCRLRPDPRVLDLLSGSAGAITFLLRMTRKTSNPTYLNCAIRHGDFLLEQAIRQEQGWSWPMPSLPRQQALTGYSHGNAGIAQALVELSVATGREDYYPAALQAIAWENNQFCQHHRNWPDLREVQAGVEGQTAQTVCCSAWCHGAPGIALSRLALLKFVPEEMGLMNDINTAIAATVNEINQSGLSTHRNFSLCHGLCGNADILLTIGQSLQRPELVEAAYRVGRLGLNLIEEHDLPWPCGLQGAGELPQLMMGTAGIGLFYLRLYDPEHVASPLLHSSHVETRLMDRAA